MISVVAAVFEMRSLFGLSARPPCPRIYRVVIPQARQKFLKTFYAGLNSESSGACEAIKIQKRPVRARFTSMFTLWAYGQTDRERSGIAQTFGPSI